MAIDIGGSKYMVGILREDGKLLASQRHTWADLTADGVFGSIISASKDLLDKYPQYGCAAAGATIPGLADASTGVWIEASFSGIRNFPIGDMFADEMNLGLTIENDANACAIAEGMFGAAKGISDFVYFTVSNGCGGALYLNGGLYPGGLGNAGEVGHIIVEENGRSCGCGSIGCFEAHASGRGLAENYMELGGEPLQGGYPDAGEIAELARGGYAEAIAAYEREGYYIGKVAAIAANILSPAMIVIGGGVSMAFDLFEGAMQKTFREQTYNRACEKVRIVKTGLGYEGGLIAAGAIGLQGIGIERGEQR